MTIDKWRNHIEACEASGLSKAAYARKHNLDYSQLIYWCKKYDNSIDRQSNLIEVILPPPETKPEPTSYVPGNALGVMEYPNGVKLHIHHPDLLKNLPDWRG